MKAIIAILLLFVSFYANTQTLFNDVFSAIDRNDLVMVKKILSTQTEVPRNKQGFSPISYAAMLGRTKIIEYLISTGINVDFNEKNFVTPLMLACKNAQLETIALLLKKGANINAQTRKLQYTPIIYACKSHSYSTFKLLVDNGANINITTKYKNTLLHILSEENYQNILLLLNDPILNDLNHNSFVSVEQYIEDTVKIAKLLIDRGIDINAKNDEGFTPIMFTIKNNNISLFNLFIKMGADLKIANIYDETPLKLAQIYKREKIVKIITNKLQK